jgi:ligand-binding SRPBCC domain-containing protein
MTKQVERTIGAATIRLVSEDLTEQDADAIVNAANSHLHSFDEVPGGTLMSDLVTYRLPFGPLGSMAHALVVWHRLQNIIQYRAVRIDAWARGVFRRKG